VLTLRNKGDLWSGNYKIYTIIIRMIISRRMRWFWHVACMGEVTNTKFLSENLKGRDHSEDLGTDEKMISELILGKLGGKVWTGCIWLRIGTS